MQKTSHAIIHRIYVRLGLAVALVGGVPLTASAAYATLTPPPGWSQGGLAAWATPANSYAAQTANQWIGSAARTSAMLNVGGRQIAINAALKLAPSAGRVAAVAIFANPALRTAVGIASWLGVGKVVWDAASGTWTTPSSDYPISDGYKYRVPGPYPLGEFSSAVDACTAAAGLINSVDGSGRRITNVFGSMAAFSPSYPTASCLTYGMVDGVRDTRFDRYFNIQRDNNTSCPSGWFVTPAGCVQSPPPRQLTQQEMVELLNPDNSPGWPFPGTVPNEINIPLPVELPVINPGTGVDPFPRPLFVPTGDPVRNPHYDSSKPQTDDNQPFLQPGVNVTPRPTTANPWQVDIQPVDRPQSGADPLPDNVLNPDPEENPDPGQNDKPRDEDLQTLCEKHPDILACQKTDLDTPEGEIPKSTADVSLQEENLFGAGSCPADVYFAPHGLQQFKVWDWNQACGYITDYLKPILIICCTFAAFMILVPGRTE